MAFTKLEKDMNIIQKLDDEPNDVGGMTSAELKAKFDEGNNAMKEWINNTFIPEAERELNNARLESLPKHAHLHSASGTDPITPHMIGAKSNTNLVINHNFADPIDQRGGYVVPPGTPYYTPGVAGQVGITESYVQVGGFANAASVSNFYYLTGDLSSYTVSEDFLIRGYVGNNGYGPDGWKVWEDTTLLLTGDGFHAKISGSNNWWSYSQPFENPSNCAGKTVTISALVEFHTGVGCVGIYYVDGDGNALTKNAAMTTEGVYSVTVTLPDTLTELVWFVGRVGALDDTEIVASAPKLELGPTQTLAHQDENGNWVLNDPPPNKQQELAKCRRYYREFNNREGWVPLGIARWRSQYRAELVLQLPVSMRIPPTVVMPDLHAVTMIPHDGSADRNPSAMSLNTSTRDAVVIHIDCAEAIGEIGCCTEIWLNGDAVKTRLAVDAGM